MGTQKDHLDEMVPVFCQDCVFAPFETQKFFNDLRFIFFKIAFYFVNIMVVLNMKPGLLLRVCNENLIFLFLNQNICCGYSKEPSR